MTALHMIPFLCIQMFKIKWNGLLKRKEKKKSNDKKKQNKKQYNVP